MNKIFINQKKGAAMYLLVVVIGAAALIMALNASFIGLSELNISLTSSKSNETESIAQGCIDEILHKIKKNHNYGLTLGNINLNMGTGSCIITVQDLGGNLRQIDVLASLSYYNKSIRVVVNVSGNKLLITSWEELTN